ncbi:RING and UBP finger domain-containing protein [Histoplasma ohiense]|nr:RING and UBP finger domain-containing protein [Histoplasma ohiense (nom. inval.)]
MLSFCTLFSTDPLFVSIQKTYVTKLGFCMRDERLFFCSFSSLPPPGINMPSTIRGEGGTWAVNMETHKSEKTWRKTKLRKPRYIFIYLSPRYSWQIRHEGSHLQPPLPHRSRFLYRILPLDFFYPTRSRYVQ